MVKCIRIAVEFFLPLGRLSATVAARAARAMRSASGGLNRDAAIETNGILTYMLLFSPGRVSLEATTTIHH